MHVALSAICFMALSAVFQSCHIESTGEGDEDCLQCISVYHANNFVSSWFQITPPA